MDTARRAFLFTDIEGSTRRWAEHEAAMAEDLLRHDDAMRQAFGRWGGRIFSNGGDGFGAVFPTTTSALRAAADAQRALAATTWANPDGIVVRMGVHAGHAQDRGGDCFGNDVNVAARVMSAAHGGQIVVSADSLDQDRPGADLTVRPLGTHRLRDLAAPLALCQLEGPGLAERFPPLRSVDETRTSLPPPRTRWIGDKQTVRRVGAAIAGEPLVTLVGPGGVGKTRLALEAAQREVHARPDGTWFVDLTGATDGTGVAEAIATGARLPLGGAAEPLGQVIAALRDRRCLLVIDNCEHIIDDVAHAAERLLDGCPTLAVLATSREALQVRGEQVVEVAPLTWTDELAPAAQLFRERAAAVGVAVDPGRDGSDIAALCAAVEGLPLAIELVAAQARTLGIAALAKSVADGLPLGLASGRPSGGRHASLASAIGWSYDLLGSDEQGGFRALSVFRSSFDLAAASAVLRLPPEEAIGLLDRLVVRSMLTTVPASREARFRMLVPLRSFAAERLLEEGELPEVARRHAHHFLGAMAMNPGDDPSAFLDPAEGWEQAIEQHRLDDPELANAADLAMAHGLEDLVVGATPIAVPRLAVSGSVETAVRWTARARAHATDDRERGEAEVMEAFLHMIAGDEPSMIAAAQEAERLLGPDSVWTPAAPCLQVAFSAALDPEGAQPAYDRASRLADDQHAPLRAFGHAVWGTFSSGAELARRDPLSALARLDRAARVFDEVASRTVLRFVTSTWRGLLLSLLGEPSEGLRQLDAVAALAPHTGWGSEWVVARAVTLVKLERAPEARSELVAATDSRLTNVWPFQRGTLLCGYGVVALHTGELERAVELLRAVGMTRSLVSTAVAYEHLALAEGWPETEFVARRREAHDQVRGAGAPGRQEPAAARLLLAERDRLGPLELTASHPRESTRA